MGDIADDMVWAQGVEDDDTYQPEGPYLVHERACYFDGEKFAVIPHTDEMCCCAPPVPGPLVYPDFNDYFNQTLERKFQESRRQCMSTDARTITDLARAANETPAMGRSSKFPAARERVAVAIADALGSSDAVKKTWVLNGVTGPMGGVSEQVHGIIDLDGDLMPFVVSVYSDAQIDKKVVQRLEEAKRDREVNQSLASLLEP